MSQFVIPAKPRVTGREPGSRSLRDDASFLDSGSRYAARRSSGMTGLRYYDTASPSVVRVERESVVPVDKAVHGFEKIVHNTSAVFNAVAAGLLFLLMLAGATDVIGRYLFNAPINGTMERGQLILALMVFLSWGYTQIKKGHVKVELFTTRFPPRLRLITDLFTTLVTLGLCILIVWQSTIMAIETHQSGEVVFVIHWPLAPFQLIVPLGGVVLCLVLVMEIIQFVYKLKRRD